MNNRRVLGASKSPRQNYFARVVIFHDQTSRRRGEQRKKEEVHHYVRMIARLGTMREPEPC